MSDCEHCSQANNKLLASKDQAYNEGYEWAKSQGLTTYVIVLKPNKNGWKFLSSDEPNLNERFPKVIPCYL